MATATSLQNWEIFKMVELLILLQAMFWILMNTESPFSKECYCLFSDIVSSGMINWQQDLMLSNSVCTHTLY